MTIPKPVRLKDRKMFNVEIEEILLLTFKKKVKERGITLRQATEYLMKVFIEDMKK